MADVFQKTQGEELTAGTRAYLVDEKVTATPAGESIGTVAVDAAAADATVLVELAH
jgi:predicted RecA/RadA family phage recombinase